MPKAVWIGIIVVILGLAIYAICVAVAAFVGSRGDTALEAKKAYERAYFEGQRDAMTGDIRIRKIDNRTYVWTRAPYNDTTKPFADTLHTNATY